MINEKSLFLTLSFYQMTNQYKNVAAELRVEEKEMLKSFSLSPK